MDSRSDSLSGKRVALAGRLAGMSKREAARLIRRQGGTVVEKPDPTVDLIVVGEEGLPLGDSGNVETAGDATQLDGPFDPEIRRAIEEARLAVIPETELWQQLGLVEAQHDVRRLYTPAMLADLLGVPLAIIRRWHRRGLIVPVREVRRLPYFDFGEVATARRLAEMLAAGMSPKTIERKLGELARYWPTVTRPLAQLSVIVEGRQILLRQGDGLLEPGGQMRFDFEAAERAAASHEALDDGSGAAGNILSLGTPEGRDEPPSFGAKRPSSGAPLSSSPHERPAPSCEQMCQMAAELEEDGQIEAAVEMLRAALVAGGPVPELYFQLAELLYRMHDLSGARERYYSTIELDENYVEARANLGCVLAESGQLELAVAAFEGALAFHGDYADVHYHLARTLDQMGRHEEAEQRWRTFLDLAPDSPWADSARARLADPSP